MAFLVSTRTHFQFKYRAFLSRSHLTSRLASIFFFPVGVRYYIHTRELSRADRGTHTHRLRLRELSNELITSRASRIWDEQDERNATRGRHEDDDGEEERWERAGSFLAQSINGAVIRECINKFGVINSRIIPRGGEASPANFASRSRAYE